jgi:membrane protease YdiL (CAAX protease family)
MGTKGGLRGLLCPFLLLILIYLIWFVRYLVWGLFEFLELLFLMLIISYLVVLLLSIFFLKKDAKRSFSEVFRVRSFGVISIALVFAFVFQAVWFTMSLTMGGDLDLLSFPSLRGYEGYAVYSIPSAFMLYIAFSVFGAFVEEVTFRGYVQSRIASRHGQVISVVIASLLFSLQHIHVFQLGWIEEFFQTQFIYVLCFGVFVGYLFFKSEEDVWSVFAFHGLMNFFNVSLPIEVTYSFPFAMQVVTIASFSFMILLLRLVPLEELIQTTVT